MEDRAGGIRKWPETEGGRAPCGSAAEKCFRETAKELGFKKLR